MTYTFYLFLINYKYGKPAVLKMERASELPGWLANTQFPGPTLERDSVSQG